jgi:hypothetical protein
MRADRVLVVLSLALALAAAVVVLGPLHEGRDPTAFPYVFLPAVAALLPLATDRLAATLMAATLMLLFMFLEVLTIGVYYLPAAGAMAYGALLRSRS